MLLASFENHLQSYSQQVLQAFWQFMATSSLVHLPFLASFLHFFFDHLSLAQALGHFFLFFPLHFPFLAIFLHFFLEKSLHTVGGLLVVVVPSGGVVVPPAGVVVTGGGSVGG